MIVVILHCHYERGGVTQVVENHVRSLRDCENVERIVLASGPRQTGLSERTLNAVELLTLEDFDYDSQANLAGDLILRRDRIVDDLCGKLVTAGVASQDAVLHWHNHSLGKNTAAPAVIRQLAEQGWRLLLQIHDFAEDYRPENYCRLVEAIGATEKSQVDTYLYPVGESIHYATLTQADQNALRQLGIPESCTLSLPNSVVLADEELVSRQEARAKVVSAFSLPEQAGWCLYPVRGIRRKNVGELLLLSRWMDDPTHTGLTLRPATPIEARSYDRWREIAETCAPRLQFDAGQHPDVSFLENVRAADFIVSTSVAEGFGMAFLEPWLVGREVIARRLPGVTHDFEAAGVDLHKFYDAIPVPGDRSWVDTCREETMMSEAKAWAQLPQAFRPAIVNDEAVDKDMIDFARLTPSRQVEVLRRLRDDAAFEEAMKTRSRELLKHLATASRASPQTGSFVRSNAEVVRKEYSAEQTTERLQHIYNELLTRQLSSIHPPRNAGSGIDMISSARPYYPCRTEVLS